MHLSIPNLYYTSLMTNDDIDTIIQRGEERTVELNSKYEGSNLESFWTILIISNWTPRFGNGKAKSGVSRFYSCIFRSVVT